MSVAAAAFKTWANTAQLPSNTGELARAIGIGRPTLQAQYLRGRVPEWVVVTAARAAQLDPVQVLSVFDEYPDIADSATPPRRAEILSQVTMDDALVELLRRRNADHSPALASLQTWPDPPIPDGVRQWVDAIDPGGLRQTLQDRLRMASSNLSAQITSNRLTPQGLAEAARLADTSMATGFAVAGIITLEEARWTAAARQDTVTGLRDSELHDLVTARIALAQRSARRRDADEDAARRIQDTLG